MDLDGASSDGICKGVLSLSFLKKGSYELVFLGLCFVCKYSLCCTSWNTRTGAIFQLMETAVWICEGAEVVMLERSLPDCLFGFLHPGCFAGNFLPCR